MSNHACAIITQGLHTDIVIKYYSNRIFLIVTHFKKVGSFVAIDRDYFLNNITKAIFSTKILFGNDDIHIHAAARYIAEQINSDKTLLLGISLKNYDAQTLKAIVTAINEIKPW